METQNKEQQKARWLVPLLVLGMCLCGATSLAAPKTKTLTRPTPRPKAPQAKTGRHSMYLFKDGSLIGLSVQYTQPYPMEMLINTAHKLQWVRCQVEQANLIILPQGGVLLNHMKPTTGFQLTFNQQGRLERVGKTNIRYDLNGRIGALGKTTFGYDPHGRLYKIGGITIKYRADRKVEKIGVLPLAYQADGRIASFGSLLSLIHI